VEEVIRTARKNGAYVCAPKELALAETHLQRTRDELDLGHYVPAREHVSISDENARLAVKMSPPEKCASQVPQGGDRDGDGIPDNVDRCPDQPEDKDGFEDQDGCPDLDNDNDGIPDATDKCPNEPEDKDGFEDEDGCPDPDNDNDGIPDATDKCPNEPEDVDGFEDADGCPDPDNDGDTIVDLKDRCPNEPGPPETDGCPQKYKLVVVTDQKIELKQMVYFATAKTRVLPQSFPLLNEVAQVLKDRPSIHVRIEGHTDSRGNDDYNLRLSQGRTNSVRAYLIGRGIAAERMEAIGYGETRPIASNRTRAGRAMNRRVEFFITKQ
jgi:outer membrane protein OmpA-like peptidoglycan-associated protein